MYQAKAGFDEFFDSFIRPLGEAALKSHLIKNYIFVDMVLVTVKFVDELGGDIDQAISELSSIETMLSNIRTINELREQVRKILVGALVFRDGQTGSQYGGMIRQVKDYIETNFMNAELLLSDAAALVNLSSSHFSMVFSQETCQTFKEYLTEVRITKAKELLRTTILGASEISNQVGYSDPHYFSFVFKKNTGLSPTEFRLQVQENPKDL
jgi:two-component system response regulator YesN